MMCLHVISYIIITIMHQHDLCIIILIRNLLRINVDVSYYLVTCVPCANSLSRKFTLYFLHMENIIVLQWSFP